MLHFPWSHQYVQAKAAFFHHAVTLRWHCRRIYGKLHLRQKQGKEAAAGIKLFPSHSLFLFVWMRVITENTVSHKWCGSWWVTAAPALWFPAQGSVWDSICPTSSLTKNPCSGFLTVLQYGIWPPTHSAYVFTVYSIFITKQGLPNLYFLF